ncbi:ABC transporter permease [Streptomyces sp. NPDC020403]|uniref:ABC transporter permease n=1 Tax=unclassified Streptomyces TaxID=2593676 RepID=UPI0033D8E5D0
MSTTRTLTDTADGRATRPGFLRGLMWLVLRQHRATMIAALTLVVSTSLWIVYQRSELTQLLDAAGWPEKDAPIPVVGRQYEYLTMLLSSLPVILAVFLGAPLIAADQEQGTAQLVTTQSVTRRRWLTAKLGWCFLTVLAGCAVLSALFTWFWQPHRSVLASNWLEGEIFDSTGPVLPALALFLTAAGVAIGILLRRVLAAMVATFVFSVGAQVVWGELIRRKLGTPRMLTYPLDGDLPARLNDAYELDRWVGSADGTLYGWGSCAEATEKATDACIKEKGIVNNVVEYYAHSQMAGMQWAGAGILLAGTALLTGFVLWWAARRPV